MISYADKITWPFKVIIWSPLWPTYGPVLAQCRRVIMCQSTRPSKNISGPSVEHQNAFPAGCVSINVAGMVKPSFSSHIGASLCMDCRDNDQCKWTANAWSDDKLVVGSWDACHVLFSITLCTIHSIMIGSNRTAHIVIQCRPHTMYCTNRVHGFEVYN